jgi:hypothetical protein
LRLRRQVGLQQDERHSQKKEMFHWGASSFQKECGQTALSFAGRNLRLRNQKKSIGKIFQCGKTLKPDRLRHKSGTHLDTATKPGAPSSARSYRA